MLKIDSKIKGFSLVKQDSCELKTTTQPAPLKANVLADFDRPEILISKVVKIPKNPNCQSCATYVTVGFTVIDGVETPVEVFINTKDLTHYQWTTALTRLITTSLLHGVSLDTICKELLDIHDPKGGYLYRQEFIPSITAQIAKALQKACSQESLEIENETVKKS